MYIKYTYYQSSGEQSSATETDPSGLSNAVVDVIGVWIVTRIYGFFIGKIVDTEFIEIKYKRFAICLLIGIGLLFFIITLGIRSIFDGLDWEINRYLYVWALSQGQGWVLTDNGVIIVKFWVGKFLIPENAHKTAQDEYQLMHDQDDFDL